MKNCKMCNKEYTQRTKKISYFCSVTCQKQDYYIRKKEGLTFKPVERVCGVCSKPFLATVSHNLYCTDECKSVMRKKVNVDNNRKYRKEFRDKYGIPSSREFAEFVHNQELLDSNPVLLEALQTIHKIKQTKGSKIPEEIRRKNAEVYRKEYHKRPLDYGKTKCLVCESEIIKKRDNHVLCSAPCRMKHYNKQRKNK